MEEKKIFYIHLIRPCCKKKNTLNFFFCQKRIKSYICILVLLSFSTTSSSSFQPSLTWISQLCFFFLAPIVKRRMSQGQMEKGRTIKRRGEQHKMLLLRWRMRPWEGVIIPYPPPPFLLQSGQNTGFLYSHLLSTRVGRWAIVS